MTSEMITQVPNADALMEKVLVRENLADLTPSERNQYYNAVCQSTGLNPLTRPFEYIVLNDKLTLYARKDATDQLRKTYAISVEVTGREKTEGVYVVTAKASTPDGRMDESIGAVALEKEEGTWETSSNGKKYLKKTGKMIPMKGDDLANAFMKAETKAKRRVTLSICGLGILDESELESIADKAPLAEVSAKPVPTVEEFVKAMTDSEDLEALKINFGLAREAYYGNADALDKIMKAKDKRKKALTPDALKKEVDDLLNDDLPEWAYENRTTAA